MNDQGSINKDSAKIHTFDINVLSYLIIKKKKAAEGERCWGRLFLFYKGRLGHRVMK